MPSSTPFWKRCFNPKVLIGLGVFAVLLFLILPGKTQAGSLIPILLVLACPLSMLFMMRGMHGSSCRHEEEHGKREEPPEQMSKQLPPA